MNKLLAWTICFVMAPIWVPGWVIANLCIGLEETWLAMGRVSDITEATIAWALDTVKGKTKLSLSEYIEARL